MTPPEARHEIAKAIYVGRNGCGCTPWGRITAAHQEPYLKDADASIAALLGAEIIPVPRELLIKVRDFIEEAPRQDYGEDRVLSWCSFVQFLLTAALMEAAKKRWPSYD